MKLMKYLRSRSAYLCVNVCRQGVPIISGVLSVSFLLMMNALVFATTATPDQYEVTCYKTEISTNGTTWVTCFDNPAGELIDLASPTGPGSLFGQGDVPEGTYKHIRITIMNTITYSCLSPVVAEAGFNPYIAAADAHVPVYFSIDGGTSWSHDGSELIRAFPLPDPIKVEYGVSTKVLINFIITNSLNDNSGWSLEPPVMNVSSVVIKALAVAFTGGDYYFDRSNISIEMPPVTSTITPTYMMFQSGWGKITFTNPVDNQGLYTISAGADNTENSQQINNGGGSMSGTIQAPEIYMGSTDMTGTYYIDPSGFMNMIMPQSGIIRGAVSDDGRVFIAVETGVVGSYHMIYAIKKETQTARDLNGQFIFNMYGSRLSTTVDATDTPYPMGYGLEYQVELGMVDINAAGNALTPSGISNRLYVERPMSDTQVIQVPVTDPYSNTESATLSTDTNGTWTLNAGDSTMQGYTLPDDSVTLLCGSTITNSYVYTYTDSGVITKSVNAMQFGVVLNPVTLTSFTVANVQGSYTFVYRGDWYGNDSGITATRFWVMLGRITFDGAGSFTGSITRSERGETTTEEITGNYGVTSEDVGAAGATMSVRVIRLYGGTMGNTDPRNGPHLIMTPNKKVGMVYVPATQWLPDGDASPVETPNVERGMGFAVKTN